MNEQKELIHRKYTVSKNLLSQQKRLVMTHRKMLSQASTKMWRLSKNELTQQKCDVSAQLSSLI